MKYQKVQDRLKPLNKGINARIGNSQREHYVNNIFFKVLFVVLYFSFFSFYSNGQSNNEIDRLYEVYEDKDKIQLTTPHGIINGSVVIRQNEDNLPKAIIILGSSSNEDAVVAHLANTINMKLKQGYRPIKNYLAERSSYSELLSFKINFFSKNGSDSFEMAFTKGNMRFTARIERENYNFSGTNYYFWQIETADTKREVTSGGSDFIF